MVERLVDLAERMWMPGLALAAAGVWGIVLGVPLTRRLRRRSGDLPLLVILVSTGPVATAAEGFAAGEIAGIWLRLSQAATLLSVVAAVMALRGAELDRRVAAGVIAFYGAALLGGLLGAEPAITQPLIVSPLILLAAARQGIDTRWVLRIGAGCCTVLAALSIFAILVVPDVGFHELPGGRYLALDRAQGVMSHPNGLGALGALTVVLHLIVRAPLHRIAMSLGLASLVLAQSYTSWLMFGAALLFVSGQSSRVLHHGRRVALLAGAAALVVLTMAPGMLADRVESVVGDPEALTGRRTVWELALAEHDRNPWFGYGPTLLNEEYRARHGFRTFEAAGQAHNQVVQTMGDSGYVGLAGLAVLIWTWVTSARRNPAAKALLALLLVRAMTETPFRPAGGGFGMFALVLVAAALTPQPGSQVSPNRVERVTTSRP